MRNDGRSGTCASIQSCGASELHMYRVAIRTDSTACPWIECASFASALRGLSLGTLCPGIEHLALELWPKISGNRSEQASRVGLPLQHRFGSRPGDRALAFERHTLTRTVIDDSQTAL
jgi:hypothetical protein